eukprot:scaffold2.g7403.t1
MQLAQPLQRSQAFRVAARVSSARHASRGRQLLPAVRASATPEEKSVAERLALPAAAVLSAALFFAATPDEALAARSGGRVGGSAGFSSRRAAPRAAPRSSGPTYNYYSAPPLVGGYGYGGFGGFGLPFFPGFGVGYGMPIFFPGVGFLFNIMASPLMSCHGCHACDDRGHVARWELAFFFVVNIVWSVVRNFTNSNGRGQDSYDDNEPW